MKYEVKISRLAVVCVLCTAAFSNAFGAATVRSLGGVGTYSGTSAAASGGTGAVRAGSLRVMPSAGTAASASSNKVTATTGNTASSSRLSIGKYLGGVKTTKPSSSGGSGSSGGGSMDPDVAADLGGRIGELEKNVYSKGDVDAALSDKQNVLTSADDYIIIDKDEIYLDVDALQADLGTVGGQDGKDGRDVDIVTDGTGIYWQYSDDPSSKKLLAEWGTLQGPQGEPGTVDVTVLKQAVEDAVVTRMGDYAKTTDIPSLDGYAKTADIPSLDGYATTDDVDTKLQTKASTASVEALATTVDGVNTAATNAATAAASALSAANEASTTAAAAQETAEAVSVTLASKADKTALNAKADKDEIPTKTSQLTNDSNFLTGAALEGLAKTTDIPSLEGYAKSSDIAETYATKEALEQAVIDAADIDLSGYATTAALEYKADKTALNAKADKDEIPTKTSQLTNDSNFLTDAALEGLAKTTDIPSLDGYAKTTDIPSLDAYATTDDVDTKLQTKASTASVEALATTVDGVNTAATNAATAAASALSAANEASTTAAAAQEAATAANTALASKADKTALNAKADKDEIPTKTSQLTNDSNFLTGVALEGLAKTTDIPSLDGYAKTTDIPSLDGYAKSADVALTYATKEALEQAVIDAADIDLSGYATTVDVTEKLSKKANTDDLGDLASKNSIDSANDIADGVVAKAKLDSGVQETLDKALTTDGSDSESYQILGVYNGEKVWLNIE